MQDRGNLRSKGPEAIKDARNKGEGKPPPSVTLEEAERKLARGFSVEIMVDAEFTIGDGKVLEKLTWIEIRDKDRLHKILEIAKRNGIGVIRR